MAHVNPASLVSSLVLCRCCDRYRQCLTNAPVPNYCVLIKHHHKAWTSCSARLQGPLWPVLVLLTALLIPSGRTTLTQVAPPHFELQRPSAALRLSGHFGDLRGFVSRSSLRDKRRRHGAATRVVEPVTLISLTRSRRGYTPTVYIYTRPLLSAPDASPCWTSSRDGVRQSVREGAAHPAG